MRQRGRDPVGRFSECERAGAEGHANCSLRCLDVGLIALSITTDRAEIDISSAGTFRHRANRGPKPSLTRLSKIFGVPAGTILQKPLALVSWG